ncbi:MAG: deoxyribodipyrimidine photo-lyase [Brevundimonas sp.]|uniref:cryptochrome/photolyase family protein n=1 Tax=Brevundimonas sp. TaxID=1871086 RepID=UPI00271AADB9|nr:deoxyribodipyrimidine photo-lyase [Brevundimonas sp.]MDO9586847.1 deoxyribodipyrimidine photo-lyase [Brevundimonas sp.]
MGDDSANPVILWFRRDLRLDDNPALNAAVETGRPILAIYILDEVGDGRRMGAASGWWLDKSLRALDASLRRGGGRLILRRGDSEVELRRLVDRTGANQVFMNRRFEPDAFNRDADIAHALRSDGVECHGFNGSLLCQAGAVLTDTGRPYRVFTPFLKAFLKAAPEVEPTTAPGAVFMPDAPPTDDIDGWGLHPSEPDWSGGLLGTPGEAGGKSALAAFLDDGLGDYTAGRDRPGRQGTSRLSPHLHWGEISPRRAVHAVRDAVARGRVAQAQCDKFVAEIGWREFSAHLLHHFPYMAERAFRPEFDTMPWRSDPEGLSAWKSGRTGYPLVDAGMRELWATGWMHNRVRMVVASFLVKHLLIDWREGEAWFWDTLVDADLASNVQNWQWVAGCGADAAPWFRIFNPVLQGEKFDADGLYVRRWVPELRALPDRWLHAPWSAPAEVLGEAGVRLGCTYPRPVVGHGEARARALAALKILVAGARDAHGAE